MPADRHPYSFSLLSHAQGLLRQVEQVRPVRDPYSSHNIFDREATGMLPSGTFASFSKCRAAG